MIREVRYVTTSFEVVREDHALNLAGDFIGSLGGDNAVVRAGYVWLVDRIYYRFTGATGGPIRIYSAPDKNSLYFADTVDSFLLPPGATYPLENTADETNPVIIPEGKGMILEARNGAPNERIFIHVDYRVAQLQQIWVPDAIGSMDAPAGNGHPAGSALASAPVHSRRPFA